MRFQIEDILSSFRGKEVRKKYVDVAKQMKDYSTALYENWVRDVNDNVTNYLKAAVQGPADQSGCTQMKDVVGLARQRWGPESTSQEF